MRRSVEAKRRAIEAVAHTAEQGVAATASKMRRLFRQSIETIVPADRRTYKPATPHPKFGLVGLALSGGGIRSATFNLGVLQVLAREGILKYVDYLSTVSGGGYLGSSLSSLFTLDHLGPDAESFPYRHEPGRREPEALRHLRNAGNYLAPRGILNVLRIPALLLRGVIVNFLTIIPYLVLLAYLTDVLYGDLLRAAVVGGPPIAWWQFFDWTPWVGVAFLALVLISPLVRAVASSPVLRGRLRDVWGARNRRELTFGAVLLALVATVAVEAMPTLLLAYHQLTAAHGWDEIALSVVAGLTGLQTMFVGKTGSKLRAIVGKLALLGVGLLGPVVLLWVYLQLGQWVVFDDLGIAGGQNVGFRGILWLAAIGLWVYTFLIVDPNSTSLHSFYRDRLSKAYLFRVRTDGEVDESATNDRLGLAELSPPGTMAPYHLVNGTLNLQASDDPDLLGREADFFLFSKHFVGSTATGYVNTTSMVQAEPRLNLGTAMAISGAAAAPNMGTATFKPLVFLMTLLNIRLGYWLPNPSRVGRLGPQTLLRRTGPILLLREFFSKLTARSLHVNVSDGGHIENLAIYELLRRRCKFIIACDAEGDGDMHFRGLAKLVRYAQIDMAIKIEIDLSCIRGSRENGPVTSTKHWALGTIHYGPDASGQEQKGCLLYVKSSITGDENAYIREYRDRKLEFPHESTADQFFSEEQFEAYRALGYHIGNDLFVGNGPAAAGRGAGASDGPVAQWFRDLAADPAPAERTMPECG